MINIFLEKILNICFPITCYFCHRPGSFLCATCEGSRFIRFLKLTCHVCHGQLRVPGIYIHGICAKKTYLNGLFSSYVLNDDLKKYLGQIKYSFHKEMLEGLKLVIKQTLANRSFSYDLITFVPLHLSRQRWRGFNQAEEIARLIDPRCLNILTKTRGTRSQSRLSRIKRKLNVEDCFECVCPDLVKGKTILICDDVYTTGSTLNSCSKALKQAGANLVYGYCLAIDELPADCPKQ